MYAHKDKPKENKYSVVVNSVAQNKRDGNQKSGIVDNRVESVVQRKREAIPCNSLNITQLSQLNSFIDSRSVIGNQSHFMSLTGVSSSETIQRKYGGSYSETFKADAHHMPSARAIAAIIEVNKDSNKTVSDCHTLAVNDIYRGAPAVWMDHEEHKATRTFGGRSTGSLTSDFNIIKGKDPNTAFDEIQKKDVDDFNNITKDTNSKDGLKLMCDSSASTDTKTRINNAIKNDLNVMVDAKKGQTSMVNAFDVLDDLIAIYDAVNQKYTLAANFIGDNSDGTLTAKTISNIINKKVSFIHANTADYIRHAADNLT